MWFQSVFILLNFAQIQISFLFVVSQYSLCLMQLFLLSYEDKKCNVFTTLEIPERQNYQYQSMIISYEAAKVSIQESRSQR